jgi:hypothetical protein
MVKDDIINELQYIPEAKLVVLYDLIHYYRLGLTREAEQPSTHQNGLKIDEQACLDAFAKIKRSDKTDFTE